jgi:hypothetical protein
VFDIDLQHCPNCGTGERKIIAAILERPVIEKMIVHRGLDRQPPPKGRVREAGLHFYFGPLQARLSAFSGPFLHHPVALENPSLPAANQTALPAACPAAVAACTA